MQRWTISPTLAVVLSTACLAPACGGDADDAEQAASGAGATGGGASGSGGAGEGGTGVGGGPLACAGTEVDTSALVFDGKTSQVSMGAAPELGLEQLTVEAWIRRDGNGATFGTGVGGVVLVPIAGKGRGESDGSNVDCNYAFGLAGEVLGADFEDMAIGANHPILGKTPIAWGVWHHVAASYDGTTWRLYLDGQLDAELAANATPRGDSIQHFGIGSAFDSMGTAAGHFEGAIDEVRVWDHARTDAEIEAGRYATIEKDTGLVGRWALDQGDPAKAADSAGPNDGTITDAIFAEPGAVLDQGLPPALAEATPADQAEVSGTSVELAVELDDPDSDAFAVEFHVREVSDGDDFTVVVLPDTQYYTVQAKSLEHYFHDQTKWVRDNREAYNIVAVIHNGDIVDNGNIDYQWSVADAAMSTLETPEASLPEGMPYGVCVGNHDQSPNSATGGTTKFNIHFGVDRFADKSYYGGHYAADKNDENWFTFSAGNLDFVVVDLQYDTTPDAAVQAWARSIFEAHPDAFGILNTHYIVNAAGEFGAQGKAIYAALKDVQNLQLMTNGHISAEARRTDTFEGHAIHSMLADYQGRADGGSGWMRIWEFSPQNGELTVRTYSPTLDKWETDDDSEFTLPVTLPGAGAAFKSLSKVDPATSKASASFEGLKPGRVYEWYAEVTDCAHSMTTLVHRFTTAP